MSKKPGHEELAAWRMNVRRLRWMADHALKLNPEVLAAVEEWGCCEGYPMRDSLEAVARRLEEGKSLDDLRPDSGEVA